MTFKLTLREDRPATIQEHRELRDDVARLRTALVACAATFDTGPTTIHAAAGLLAEEFQRRMNIAGAALNHKPGEKGE